MENETWKDIPGYEGKYQISNLARVKSLERTRINIKGAGVFPVREKILKGCIGKEGYPLVSLSKDSQVRHFRIHRLVAIAFIPNPMNKPTVNHKNGIRRDTRLENLEWCTNSENHLHAYRVLGKKPNNKKCRL